MATQAPRHPAYPIILRRLLREAPRKGLSLHAIRKAVQGKYKLPDSCRRGIRLAVHRGLKSGLLSHGSSSQTYKLSKRYAKRPSKKNPKTARAMKTFALKKVSPKKRSSPAASLSGSPALSPFPSPKKATVTLPKKISKSPISRKSFTQAHIWQYVDNSGKFDDYDPSASDAVEECYQEYLKNPHMMDVRAVRSGDWQYQVDFLQMKQTNINHENHRVRTIRRIPNPYL